MSRHIDDIPNLDTSNMEAIQVADSDGELFWCYVDHRQHILTHGFRTRDALERNRDTFLNTPTARDLMRGRYERRILGLNRESMLPSGGLI